MTELTVRWCLQIQRSVRRRSPAAKHAQVRSRSGSNRDSEAPAEPRAGCQRDDTSHADAAGRRALLLLRSVAAARQSLAAHAVGFGAAGVIITIAACAYAQAVKVFPRPSSACDFVASIGYVRVSVPKILLRQS